MTITITVLKWVQCYCKKKKQVHYSTLLLDRDVIKGIKENIKYSKKGQSTYCHKGQVLVQAWQNKRDVKLISVLHTAKIVETARQNRKGEKMKKLKIIKTNKFMRYVDRAD